MAYPGQQWNQQRQAPPQGQPQQYVVNAQQQPVMQQAPQQGQPQYAQQPQVVYVQQGQQPPPQVQYVQQGQQPVQYVPQGQQPPPQQLRYGQPPQQQQQVQYVQQPPPQGQPQYAPQGQPQYVQQGQPQYVPQGQPQYVQQGQPPQYVQQGHQPQVQYVQQGQPPQQVQYAQQGAPQYAQPPPQQPQPQQAQGGVYGRPQVVKNAGPPPPSYGSHQQQKAKTLYQLADEKVDTNKNAAPYGGGQNVSTWEQPRADAKGTCPVHPNFNQQVAMEAAKELRKAMKGMGCDKKKVAEITGSYNSAQRAVIRNAFRTVDQVLFGKGKERNLLKDLKSELGGSYENLVLACYEGLSAFDARLCLKACAGMGFNSELLIEVVCTRTNKQISAMKSAWTTSLGQKKSLVDRVREETKKLMSGNHFQHLMVTLLEGKRPANKKPDADQVHSDAETLNRFLSQEKKRDSKDKFVEIYTQRSWAHIAALSAKWSDISRKWTLQAAIKKTFGDGSDTSQALQVITKFCATPYDYWAEKLRKSMKGAGTKDDMLIRLVVTRCEIDMAQIKHIFGQRYGSNKTLKNWIEDDTSGSYCRLFIKLCGYE